MSAFNTVISFYSIGVTYLRYGHIWKYVYVCQICMATWLHGYKSLWTMINAKERYGMLKSLGGLKQKGSARRDRKNSKLKVGGRV